MTQSRALVTLPKGLLPTGGLAIFADDDPFSDNDTWPRMMIAHWGGNRASLMANLPFVAVNLEKGKFLFLLEEAVKQKILHKGDIIKFYGLQSKGTRSARPYFHLADAKQLKRRGQPLFSTDELVAIAHSVQSISQRDVEMFLSDKACHDLLSTELVSMWSQDYAITPLVRAQILEIMYRRSPKTLDQETLESVLRAAVELAPQSGAVQITMKVMYDVERTRKNAKRDRSREAFADSIVKMITPLTRRQSMGFHEAQKLLGWYLTNPLIQQEDRDWVETEVKFHIDAVARLYQNFIKHAKSSSAFDG
jgi:hypothetical protein